MSNYIKQWEPLFLQYRPYLVSFAFRMTGSLAEAEDLVQETLLACTEINPQTIENPKSWLTKVCSNKGIDHLKSAYKKRESYTGPWLPDAIPDSFQVWSSLTSAPMPDRDLLLSESLTTSFLLLIERLTPEERAVYLLSEIFEYSFKEISAFLDKSEEACRKIAERARKAVLSGHVKFSGSTDDAENLISQFFSLVKSGDQEGLSKLLHKESEFWSDGGGKVPAGLAVLNEADKIAQFFKNLGSSQVFQSKEFKLEFQMVNHRPGLIISCKDASGFWIFDSILSFEIRDHKIARIYAQRNPDKLKALPSGD